MTIIKPEFEVIKHLDFDTQKVCELPKNYFVDLPVNGCANTLPAAYVGYPVRCCIYAPYSVLICRPDFELIQSHNKLTTYLCCGVKYPNLRDSFKTIVSL